MQRFTQPLGIFGAMVCAAHLGLAGAAEQPGGHTLTVNGVKIHYSVQGQGEPVVLIHGWLSSAGLNWTLPGTTALLAKDHQVIAPDMPGHGLSDKPLTDDAYGPQLVTDIEQLLDHLQIKKAHIVGYSMGGIIAANFIAKHPDRVLSGTLGGMGWLQPNGLAQWLFSQIGKDDPNAKAAIVCGRSLATLALTEKQIQSIHVPMMVLVGDKDTAIRTLYVEPLKKPRPDWPVAIIPGADHLSCVIKPLFQQQIAAWLKKNAHTSQTK